MCSITVVSISNVIGVPKTRRGRWLDRVVFSVFSVLYCRNSRHLS